MPRCTFALACLISTLSATAWSCHPPSSYSTSSFICKGEKSRKRHGYFLDPPSAAFRASATGTDALVSLFLLVRMGARNARHEDVPAACFSRIILATASLSRAISDPLLLFTFFYRPAYISSADCLVISLPPRRFWNYDERRLVQGLSFPSPSPGRPLPRACGFVSFFYFSFFFFFGLCSRLWAPYLGSLRLEVLLAGLVALIAAGHLDGVAWAALVCGACYDAGVGGVQTGAQQPVDRG